MNRTLLSIQVTGGANLGRCYNATYFRVTYIHRLSREQILKLREMQLLGYGQEFSIKSQCDGKEEPDSAGLYVYDCEDRVDSSD